MMAETALISSHFDEAAVFLKLGEQGQGRGSAPRPPCIGAHLPVWTGAVSLTSPETLACLQTAPQTRVELQWNRLAPTLHVLSVERDAEGRRHLPFYSRKTGLVC